MFKKLFKYDMRAVSRFIVPVLIVMLALTVVGALDGIFLGNMILEMSSDSSVLGVFGFIVSYFLMLIIVFAIGAMASVVSILIMVNYYKSTVSDEAYLTFTLPVKVRDILLSKLLNSSIWSFVMLIASIICIGVIVLSVGASLFEIFTPVPSEPSLPDNAFSVDSGFVVTVVLLIVFAVCYFINSKLLHFMAITFASTITQKYKIICAIGCVLGANAIYSVISTAIFYVCSFIGVGASWDSQSPYLSLIISFSIMIVLLVGASLLFFYFTKYMLERKLNLA